MLRVQEAPDLGIPEVKPAIESIRGRWLQKMSPKTRHSLLQGRLWGIFAQWAGERGAVGTEWRYYFVPDGEKPSSLVPDVAYLAYDRMPPEGELREKPTIAPDIAVEVVSPRERRKILDVKIAMYLGFGTRLVVIVDPQKRVVEMHEAGGTKVFCESETANCGAYPDLAIDIRALFKGV
ncbi:MAG: Uma2 family endonuclease [Candidatus Eremiobacteraeota bacterium]|nr:Uma2 family endonuclease [Candidatus Eremiobacteraeota bacterium]MBV8284602.1 Uma2 family endonuclease [Candidatus Eremiobacteraeota bacterium]MBV8332155.1 Uma2 family endonuclease [Candidatus Eremiobacteraeota bacterium]MBV8434058.1 Uma2 family endonuclease [Candidatus Eremiobacteraeota bacterium]MBV8655768.1 Uma2 family endonuclease [Candidatus Eremiobacteraeota bacterium]